MTEPSATWLRVAVFLSVVALGALTLWASAGQGQ